MSVRACDLKRGQAVEFKDGIWVCADNEKVVKGKGRSYHQIQLKNFETGQLVRERFRNEDLFEPVHVDRRDMEYLYSDGSSHVFMDPESYEQVNIPQDLIGELSVYLQPNIVCQIAYVQGQPLDVELPAHVEVELVECPPNVKGATATNQLKDAVAEGGAKVKVPPFIERGETIRVDTRTGEYLGRA
ncbi:MAG: elongation factor P [Planctomycetota bacterium]